ncbi:hypothetical protein BU24DRAFT_67479 [Aaosphaeria arxii CBS 175.79]|uniref:Uncharacterized protein n=1 Tax=Aaosphaeria arxii CBS 175.79 TaxID=1450172 RepID=A0A6A5XAI8_9PLEO|nr:uncharacterized protein BU24DRAFT_67479 [Aaosphaeria arxii CBS 175.79]KAF2009923.1 hypothetical protein BU24DRAFT_67479 [Aaosphaeria arxii CBS 175.79]
MDQSGTDQISIRFVPGFFSFSLFVVFLSLSSLQCIQPCRSKQRTTNNYSYATDESSTMMVRGDYTKRITVWKQNMLCGITLQSCLTNPKIYILISQQNTHHTQPLLEPFFNVVQVPICIHTLAL